MQLSSDNYYSRQADLEYMSVSQFKDFRTCEAGALAKIRGEYADLEQQSKTWATEKASYEKAITDNKTAYDTLTNQLTEATGKIAKYETAELKTRIAIEAGLPMELRGYLNGSTEEEIKASAEELGKYMKQPKTQPLAYPEGEPSAKGDFERTGEVDETRVRKKFIDSFKILEE